MDQTSCFFSIFFMAFIATAMAQSTTDTSFIETSCSATSLPSDCLTSLLPYAANVQESAVQLIQYTLLTTVDQINVLKNRYNALTAEDAHCIKPLLDFLREVIISTSSLENPSLLKLPISNVAAWANAALKNEDDCTRRLLEKQYGPEWANTIRNEIASVAKMASIALYLIK
ncbi:21 kDa protein-like [Bidens hawaiensis]|uniref:21 kDa protein-like n=1 Tax=Bidens hawaiensis TaxID=980011 RepID=UPI00404B9E1E